MYYIRWTSPSTHFAIHQCSWRPGSRCVFPSHIVVYLVDWAPPKDQIGYSQFKTPPVESVLGLTVCYNHLCLVWTSCACLISNILANLQALFGSRVLGPTTFRMACSIGTMQIVPSNPLKIVQLVPRWIYHSSCRYTTR
jgi:hypothetical protein